MRRKFVSHENSRSIFQRRWKRRNFRPSCVAAFFLFDLCGAIKTPRRVEFVASY